MRKDRNSNSITESNKNIYYYCSECLPKWLEQHKVWKAVWTKITTEGNMTTFDNSCPWCGIWFQEGTVDDAISDHYFHKHGADKGDCGNYHKDKEYIDSWKETNPEFAEQESQRWHIGGLEKSEKENDKSGYFPKTSSKNTSNNQNTPEKASNSTPKSNTTLVYLFRTGRISFSGNNGLFLIE